VLCLKPRDDGYDLFRSEQISRICSELQCHDQDITAMKIKDQLFNLTHFDNLLEYIAASGE